MTTSFNLISNSMWQEVSVGPCRIQILSTRPIFSQYGDTLPTDDINSHIENGNVMHWGTEKVFMKIPGNDRSDVKLIITDLSSASESAPPSSADGYFTP